MSILYWIFGLFIAVLAKVILVPILKYQLAAYKYASIPKHNKEKGPQCMTMCLAIPDGGKFLIEGLRDKDGKMFPIVHYGWELDGSHNIAVTHPEGIKEIALDEETFVKHPIFMFVERMLGRGLITATGEYWKTQRRLLTPVFHFGNWVKLCNSTAGTLKKMAPPMTLETLHLVDKLKALKDEYVDIPSTMNEFTLGTVIKICFGGDFDVTWMKKEWKTLLGRFGVCVALWFIFGELVFLVPSPFYRSAAAIREKVGELIDKRRKENSEQESYDLLQKMLSVKDDEGNGLSKDTLVSQSLTFLMAGQETTAGLISWAVYFLCKYPESQKKLQDEVDSVLGNRNIEESDIPKLKYCKQVLEETLRLRPATQSLGRVASKDCVLMGYHIPKGTVVGGVFGGVQMNEEYWPNPYEFIPERFSDETKEKEEKRNPYTYLPFSAGPRNCLGQRFALQEATIAIATLAQHFEMEAHPTKKVTQTYTTNQYPIGLETKFIPRKN